MFSLSTRTKDAIKTGLAMRPKKSAAWLIMNLKKHLKD